MDAGALEALLGQAHADQVGDGLFVLNDQNADHGLRLLPGELSLDRPEHLGPARAGSLYKLYHSGIETATKWRT
jgi:hypothetical protein